AGAGHRRPRAPRADREGGQVDAALPRARHRRRPGPGRARVTKKARRMLALMDRATTVWTIPIVGRDKGRVIRRLLDRHRPTRGIELGSLLGYSAILIAGSMPPQGRLTCVEANPFLAWMVRANVAEAGLAQRVEVVACDAPPLLPGPSACASTAAKKEDHPPSLRQLEPKLIPGAVVIADNTGIARREVAPYLEHVRTSGRYDSRAYDFKDDAMEVSVFRR